MERWLIVVSGTRKGSVTRITGRVSIGRAADNTICLDDELASQHHCAIWTDEQDRDVLQDGDTRNGTWVNGRAESRIFLTSNSYIKCGSATIQYGNGPLPENLDIIIDEETHRNRALETLRADYTVRDQPVIFYRGAARALLDMTDAVEGIVEGITDAGDLQARLLDDSFEMIPAVRGAVLVNDPHVAAGPENFVSRVYRQRGHAGPASFTPSGKVLRQVYQTGEPLISNESTPILCVPLKAPGTMYGVIYLEGADPRRGFEPEHVMY